MKGAIRVTPLKLKDWDSSWLKATFFWQNKLVGEFAISLFCKVEGQVLEESPMVLSPYKIKEYIIQKYIMRRPLPSRVIWDIYGPYMGMIWDNLWAIYGFHMVLIWNITHHIKPVWCHILPLYCLIYGKDTYFIKIHTIPIYGNEWAMGMVWDDCHVKEWYGNGMGALISPIPNPHLWKRYVFHKNPYYSHTWVWYGLWEWYGMIVMRRNDMGA